MAAQAAVSSPRRDSYVEPGLRYVVVTARSRSKPKITVSVKFRSLSEPNLTETVILPAAPVRMPPRSLITMIPVREWGAAAHSAQPGSPNCQPSTAAGDPPGRRSPGPAIDQVDQCERSSRSHPHWIMRIRLGCVHDRRKWNIDPRQRGQCSISGDHGRSPRGPAVSRPTATTMIAVWAPLAALSAVFRPETAIMTTLGLAALITRSTRPCRAPPVAGAGKRQWTVPHGALSHSDGAAVRLAANWAN